MISIIWEKLAGDSIDPVNLRKWQAYHKKEHQKWWGAMSRILWFDNLRLRYHGSKEVRLRRQEDGSLGNLAATCHLEESASHHSPSFSFFKEAEEICESLQNPNLGHSLLGRERVRSTLLQILHLKQISYTHNFLWILLNWIHEHTLEARGKPSTFVSAGRARRTS